MRWVALFSGQGGQRAVHAHALAQHLADPLRAAWDVALARAEVTSASLDDAALARNRVAQPTLAAWQVAAWAHVAADLPAPVLVAGYSVGEIAACSAAGGYDGATAIRVAAARAEAMDAAMTAPSGLVAVLGLAEDAVAALAATTGVAIAIRNGPRHFIVGGTDPALAAFRTAATAAGAARVQRLCVNTPAHTAALAPAVPRFAAVLSEALRPGRLAVPMRSAVDAAAVRTGAEAAAALARQLAAPLDWAACMDVVVELAPDAVLEIGPGDALARMFGEAAPGIAVRSLDAFRSPAAAALWLRRQAS